MDLKEAQALEFTIKRVLRREGADIVGIQSVEEVGPGRLRFVVSIEFPPATEDDHG
jgi:hypothetical protein